MRRHITDYDLCKQGSLLCVNNYNLIFDTLTNYDVIVVTCIVVTCILHV